MTKALYPAPARIHIDVTYMSISRGKTKLTNIIATNSTVNIRNAIKNRKFLLNAIYNGAYKHFSKGGNSGFTFKINDFDIEYFDDYIINKRVYRYDKRTRKREYWSESRRKTDGKLIGRALWRRQNEINL